MPLPKLEKSPKEKLAFFDLRTTQGQIIFMSIVVLVSILVQQIPKDFIKEKIFPQYQECNLTCPNFDGIKPEKSYKKLNYWIYGMNSEGGHLKHVHLVLKRLGYELGTNESDWDLLWAHDYPFRKLSSQLLNMKSHQKVNHFPGCGFITNKVDLSTSDLKYIPKSFKLPEDEKKLLEYSVKNPDKSFVEKHNQHRHIQIKTLEKIDFSSNESFVQEYIGNPYLVDGHKFDIGVYTIITSVDPLRLYMYTGDILFRYCPFKYHPFDPANIDKYIVGDDYLPTWDVPSLSQFYNGLGFGMKDSFDAYMRSKNQDPRVIWEQVEDAIRIAVLSKEHNIANILKRYKYKNSFFELMRFDLVVDNNLKVYLMEANMSPNLSSAHFPPNQLLYEQVLFNIMRLVGLGTALEKESLKKHETLIEKMISTDKNLVVDALECSQLPCTESCAPIQCRLCRPCLSQTDMMELHRAYREHVNRGETKRIFPLENVCFFILFNWLFFF